MTARAQQIAIRSKILNDDEFLGYLDEMLLEVKAESVATVTAQRDKLLEALKNVVTIFELEVPRSNALKKAVEAIKEVEGL